MEKMNDLEQRGIGLEGKNEEFWEVFLIWSLAMILNGINGSKRTEFGILVY